MHKVFERVKSLFKKLLFKKLDEEVRLLTPRLLQMEATECGAAALAMILGYHGHHVTLDEARVKCGVSRNGSKASNMLKAARSYGLTATGYQVDTVESLKEITLPCIVFWNFNHFVVVEGYNKDGFYINDPARGAYHLPYEEFSEAFTGVVLHFEPGPDFQKEGAPPSIRQFFYELALESFPAFFYVFVLSLIFVVPMLMSAGFIKIFIDDIVVRHMNDWLRPLLIGMFLTTVVNAFLQWLRETHLLRLSLNLISSTALAFVWHTLRLPIRFYYQRLSGDIINRIQANDRLLTAAMGGINSLVSDGLIAVIFWFILLMVNVPLALIALIGNALNGWLVYHFSQNISHYAYQYQQLSSRFFSFSLMGLKMIESIKAMALELSYLKKWRRLYAPALNRLQGALWYESLVLLASKLITGITNLAVLGVGIMFVMQGHMTLGSLVAFQGLMSYLSTPFMTLVGQLESIQKLRGDLLRLEDVFHHPLEESFSLPEKDIPASLPAVSLRLDHLIFGYSAVDPPEIKDISLDAPSGRSVAIVGRTGSGKSTLVSLMLGFYTPWKGEIWIDGKPLSQYSPEERARYVGFVDSESSLWEGTVLENLNPSQSALSPEQIDQAIRDACAEDIVKSLGGLAGEIQEEGRNLSGGQRQRFELARALAQNPSILILDEATSSLDTVTENKIIQNLKKRAMTLILVSHRLSAVRDCDQILVFDKGEICERGTHHALMANRDRYYQLMVLEQ